MKAIFMGLLLLVGIAQGAEPVQRIQQMVDYLGVDYHGAVSGGQVVNASEYEEMLDFSRTLVTLAKELPDAPNRDDILSMANNFDPLSANKIDPPGATKNQLSRLCFSR